MVIILEGIDRVGKTTLVNKLSEELNAEKFKADRIDVSYNKNESNIFTYGCCLGQVQLLNKTYADSKDRHIIIDRFHWTEYVYTKVQRDKRISNCYMKSVEAEMLKNKQGYLVILMMPVDINVCSRAHGSDLKKHQELFEMVYNDSNLLKYRCTYFSNDMAINAVHKFIKGEYTIQGE